MVDLLGRKCQERISQLESSLSALERERSELKQILEKRDEKIKKLTSANQEANVALKAMMQESRQASRQAAPLEPGREMDQGRWISPSEAGMIFQRLVGIRSPRDDMLTAYLAESGRAEEMGLSPDVQRLASSAKPGRGVAVFECPGLFSMALVPPMPLKDDLLELDCIFHPEPLIEMMETPVLVVLAHAGETFLGVALSREGFEVQELVESEVKEKHSKGGWSQKRFERLREEDIRGHGRAVDLKLQEVLGKYRPVLKYAVVGGDPGLLRQISPGIELPRIERRMEKLDSRHPEAVLEDVYGFISYRA